jgi:hypothetical protein
MYLDWMDRCGDGPEFFETYRDVRRRDVATNLRFLKLIVMFAVRTSDSVF